MGWDYLGTEYLNMAFFKGIKKAIDKKQVERDFYIAKEKKEKISFKSVLGKIKRNFIKIKDRIFKKPIKYLAPLIAVCVLAATIGFFSNLEFGIKLKYTNDEKGTIENEWVYHQAKERVNKALHIPESIYETTKYIEPEMEVAFLNFNAEKVDTSYATYNKILDSSKDIQNAYGLYIDNEYIGCVENKEALEKQLNGLLVTDGLKCNKEDKPEFTNKIAIEDELFNKDSILKVDDIVSKCKDKLTVRLETTLLKNSDINFKTTNKKDSGKYDDYKKVTQKGIKGVKTDTYKVVYVNGKEESKDIISSEVTKKPVEEKVTIGTKCKGVGTGSFMWPVPYTKNITSYYGSRWGTVHRGIDISSGGIQGQNIVASDTGRVTFSGIDNSGYGYYVIISHDNGYETLYAHCSQLYVSQGDTVRKGDKIAAVGSTGDSTGSHLHFEVIKNGSKLNPMDYVG